MSTQATLAMTLTVLETLAQNAASMLASKAVVTHDRFNLSATLNANSTPAASLVAAFQKALSAGAATIDLTALVGTNSGAISMSAAKVRAMLFRNPSTNANSITVKAGTSNPYDALGASWQIILAPGQQAMFYLDEDAPTVDGTHKNIDIAGTGTQALDCIILAG